MKTKNIVKNSGFVSWKNVKKQKPQQVNLRGLNLKFGRSKKTSSLRLWT
jgi:hypothetical protein